MWILRQTGADSRRTTRVQWMMSISRRSRLFKGRPTRMRFQKGHAENRGSLQKVEARLPSANLIASVGMGSTGSFHGHSSAVCCLLLALESVERCTFMHRFTSQLIVDKSPGEEGWRKQASLPRLDCCLYSLLRCWAV
jgi:hypothetical protein